MKNIHQPRRFQGRTPILLEGLESRLLLSSVTLLRPQDDAPNPDDPPPADTQPVDPQPVDTQPVATPPTDDNGINDSSSNEMGNDDGGSDAPPVDVLPPPPDAPTSLTLQSPSSTSVYLSWSETADEADTFTIQRRDPGNRWYRIATVDGDITHFTDFNVQPGGIYSYRVFASNDAGNSPSTHVKTIVMPGITDATLIGQFGKIPGGKHSAPLTFLDADGTAITLKLTGPGVGTVRIGTAGYDLTLTGTTPASQVKISTRSYGHDDGRFTLENLAVEATDGAAASLGSMAAPTTDLQGTFDITGAAKTITLGDLGTGSIVSIGGSATPAKHPPSLSFTCRRATDAQLTSALPLRRLSVFTWQVTPGTQSIITAPSLRSLVVRAGRNIPGNFAATLSLSAAYGGDSPGR